jgi:hypothetical protein
VQITQTGKKCTKRPQNIFKIQLNIPNVNILFQMTIE